MAPTRRRPCGLWRPSARAAALRAPASSVLSTTPPRQTPRRQDPDEGLKHEEESEG
uniref:Uncharacterized protein n=1 Tax=Oryza glumipatula TaxID=40148 RepID=A0A0E0A796_9ORYZ